MRVKICGIRNETDLKAAAASGADSIGFLVGQIHSSQDFILPSTAARLAKLMSPYISPMLVTHFSDPDEVLELLTKSGIINVQLHAGATVEQVTAIREALPASSKLILGTHLKSEYDFVSMMDYYTLVDAFLLDSACPEQNKIGGTGKPHDWNLSAKFVKTCPIPVILAGGLNADNVSSAIQTVHPYGVDANSAMKTVDGVVCERHCTEFVLAARKA